MIYVFVDVSLIMFNVVPFTHTITDWERYISLITTCHGVAMGTARLKACVSTAGFWAHGWLTLNLGINSVSVTTTLNLLHLQSQSVKRMVEEECAFNIKSALQVLQQTLVYKSLFYNAWDNMKRCSSQQLPHAKQYKRCMQATITFYKTIENNFLD